MTTGLVLLAVDDEPPALEHEHARELLRKRRLAQRRLVNHKAGGALGDVLAGDALALGDGHRGQGEHLLGRAPAGEAVGVVASDDEGQLGSWARGTDLSKRIDGVRRPRPVELDLVAADGDRVVAVGPQVLDPDSRVRVAGTRLSATLR